MPDEEKQPEEQDASALQATDTSASAADASQTETRVEATAANEGDADKGEGTKVEGAQDDASKGDAPKDDEPKDGGLESVISGGQSDEQMPCSKCMGGMCLNASCAMYAAVSKPDAELIAARKAVQDAEAKLVEANKAIASLESEKSSLEARLAAVEKQLQQSVVAHRMAQLGQIMTAEQIEPYKERVGLMSEADFNLVLAAATNAPRQTTDAPKPGSLRGTFVLPDRPTGDKDKADQPKSFQGLFSNIEAR